MILKLVFLSISLIPGTLCNHVSGCAGFSWGSADHVIVGIQKKCHLKSGNVTDNIIDNTGVVSGLVGCPTPSSVIATNCSMMDKDLIGGAPLLDIENVEMWQDCGNSIISLFPRAFPFFECKIANRY